MMEEQPDMNETLSLKTNELLTEFAKWIWRLDEIKSNKDLKAVASILKECALAIEDKCKD